MGHESGYNVTVLTDFGMLAPDAPAIHYRTNLEMRYEELNNFNFITNVTVTGISKGKVIYFKERGGNEVFWHS